MDILEGYILDSIAISKIENGYIVNISFDSKDDSEKYTWKEEKTYCETMEDVYNKIKGYEKLYWK